VLIHSDALVRKRIDRGDFGRERWVEEVSVGQTFSFGDEADTFRVRGEIDVGRVVRWGLVCWFMLMNHRLRNSILT